MIIIVTFNHENAVTGKERLDKLTVQAVSLELGGGEEMLYVFCFKMHINMHFLPRRVFLQL